MSDSAGKRLRGFLCALAYSGSRRTKNSEKSTEILLYVQKGHLNFYLIGESGIKEVCNKQWGAGKSKMERRSISLSSRMQIVCWPISWIIFRSLRVKKGFQEEKKIKLYPIYSLLKRTFILSFLFFPLKNTSNSCTAVWMCTTKVICKWSLVFFI